MKSVRYDDELLPKAMSFAVEDVFVSAILSVACTVLAEIGEDYSGPTPTSATSTPGPERFRAGVVDSSDQRTGAARDYDVKQNDGYRPKRSRNSPAAMRRAAARQGTGPAEAARRSAVLRASGSEVHADPTTSPVSRDFRAREYWRGPIWPVTTWLFRGASPDAGGRTSLMLRREGCAKPVTAHSPSTTNVHG